MNTENTDKNNAFSRGFSRIEKDLKILQSYCHPEFIEEDSLGGQSFTLKSLFDNLRVTDLVMFFCVFSVLCGLKIFVPFVVQKLFAFIRGEKILSGVINV